MVKVLLVYLKHPTFHVCYVLSSPHNEGLKIGDTVIVHLDRVLRAGENVMVSRRVIKYKVVIDWIVRKNRLVKI